MILTMLKEHEDGSADVQLEDIDPRTMQLLIQEGFLSLLKKSLDLAEKEKRIPALLKKAPDEL
jgi:hypothetical protein